MAKDQNSGTRENEIDLIQMIRIIWKRKWFIILSTVLVTGISAVVSLVLPEVYVSRGFLNAYWPYRDVKVEEVKLGKVELNEVGYKIEMAESKKKIELLQQNQLFDRFLRKNINKLGLDNEFISDLDVDTKENIRVMYAYKTGQKQLENKRNFVVGFELECQASTPGDARTLILMLREFISRVIINNEIIEYININLNWEKYKITRNRNRIIALMYELEKLLEREKVMQGLSKEFPILNNPSQTVVVGNEGKHYLSPLQLLAATKIEIAEIKEDLDRIKRESSISTYQVGLLQKFSNLLKDDPEVLINIDLIDKISASFSKSLKNKNPEDELFQIAKNDIEEKLSYFDQLYSYVLRLIADPALPRYPDFPQKKIIVAAAFVIALLLFTFLAFVIETYRLREKTI